jgi:signal transduction histidine kinase
MRKLAESIVLLLSVAGMLVVKADELHSSLNEAVAAAKSGHCVTNVAQFRTLTGVDYLAGCDFHLTGVVTLVDPSRDLVVLQDASGAVALHFHAEYQKLQIGQLVTLDGTNCCPYLVSCPDYPFCPSGWDLRNLFEAPTGMGEYYLTRMRGLLHPPVTGEYTFWIASDNSSELWLSTDVRPAKARNIGFIPHYAWTGLREWSKFPSQRSDPVFLKAGESYYIEALQEQTTERDNLSVAWMGPSLDQSVIDGRYLTPWSEGREQTIPATARGILREYWTNYSVGDVKNLSGAHSFESELNVKQVRTRIHGPGALPEPDPIVLNKRLMPEDNYRMVEMEGVVKFMAADGETAFLELSDGQSQAQVRALHWSPELLKRINNARVRVKGVCEGVYRNEALVAGMIWADGENSVSVVEPARTNVSAPETVPPPLDSVTKTNSAMEGFYSIRGVVTFNDRVFDKDFTFVQGGDTIVLVSLEGRPYKNQLKLGQWVSLGGALRLGEYLPIIRPLTYVKLGWHSLPEPIAHPLAQPVTRNCDSKWSELEGVVHSVNTNGTLSIVGENGPACLWVGQTPSNCLARYVDAKLRARGVLLLTLLDAPVLLVPSRNFVDVKEEVDDPFGVPRRSVADLLPEVMGSSWFHRARVVGEVTFRDSQSFFIQDASGGIRVRTSAQPAVKVGNKVEVVAFPAMNGFVRTLTEPVVSPARAVEHVNSKSLDLSEALSFKQNGALVHVSATLLAFKTNRLGQVLELQEQQNVFTASLSSDQGSLPALAPGSRLRVTGVCNNDTASLSMTGEKPARTQMLALLNILLRSPDDVTILSSPPWWTWKRTATLVGTLLAVLLVTLFWVHLLRRRLERQQAAQLAFSRQVLERLEDERRRIAVNLHDSLGQVLLAIKNQALLAIQRPPNEQGSLKRLEEISSATSQAIDEVRQITHGLRPYQLDRLGLTQAIRDSVARASANTSIQFASRVEGIDGLFDKDSEIHVYRIVQEAVTNVVKHSTATEATVVIKKRAMMLSLSIRDNGKGFNSTRSSSQSHNLGYGLSGIAERVRILGGTLVIDTRPGGGTSLTIEVPLPVSKHETGSNSTDRG